MNLSSFAILAQAAEPAADAADLVNAGGGTSGWLLLLIVVAVFALPIALGYAIAKTLKMPEIAGRVGGILFAAVIGLTPFVYNIAVGTSEGLTVGEAFRGCLRLGIDLAGGTNLVYEVDRDATEKVIDDRVMDRMVGAVAKRINPSGTEEVTVRKVGRDRLEVIVPGADPEKVAQIKDGIVNTGTLEFAILANEVDHANLINQARTLPGTERKLRSGPTVIAEWKSVAFDEAGQAKMTSTGGRVAFRGVDEAGNLVTDADAAEAGPIDLQFLIVYEAAEARVTGKFLRNSAPTADEAGRPAVGFTFDTRGSILFGNLTTKYRPKSDGFESRLAVLLNDKIESAPALNSAITGGNGIITGRFTQAEVRELVDVLNAGALEVPLKKTPVSEFTISPLLGEDTVRKAVTSILAGGLLVLVFMGVYYLVAGAVADLCLVLNIVLVMGAMVFIDATFTLPGLAGIVLTIGMAVDANVLIFERIREESSRGASLKAAIANGFEKAFSTIVDANVTTLITAVILYAIGTDQVRGFAVTLFIGIVMSMFTALVFGRLVFDVLAQKRFIKSLKMTGIVGQTSIGFMGKVPLAAVFSVALIAVGLGAFFTRGVKMLDIDFRGGTMVTFELTESAETADVRNVLEGAAAFGGDVSVERLELADATNAVSGKLFRMRTSLKDGDGEASTDAVEKAIVDAFETSGLVLRKVSFDFTTTADAETPTAEVALGGNDEIKPDTLGRYIGAALTADEAGGYEDAASLLTIVGTDGSGVGKAESAVRSFSKLTVTADPIVTAENFGKALESVRARFAAEPVFDEVNSFDTAVAGEMQVSAITAILASLVAIVGYLWLRFESVTFGLAAVVALVHDVLIVLGLLGLAATAAAGGLTVLGLEEFKINLPIIAAFLTIIGYSLNDTIVVFDRVREVKGRSSKLTADIVDRSLNQTLARTLLTSVTTFLVVIILYAFGGEGIHGFAFCLVCGVLVGTYSSLFVASPALLWLSGRELKVPTPELIDKTATPAA